MRWRVDPFDFRKMIMGTLLVFLLACSRGPGEESHPDYPGRNLWLQKVAGGLENPLYVTSPPEDERLFIVEQPGRIRLVEKGRLLSQPFLDITDRVRNGGECGLLSLAFHPRYQQNGFFYVNYTDNNGDTHLERYSVTKNKNLADLASAKLILKIQQPYRNHNGVHIQFGPDGMLYIGMGDGGSANDPHNHGQDRSTLLGDLLRIDVDRGDPYGIPPDNPFVNQKWMRGEIWAWGLRNPWRFAFDPAEGLIYIADVGQNKWEEVHIAPMKEGGLNYGWNIMEGNHCFKKDPCDKEGLELPVLEYSHQEGCSITGGYVYRGKEIPWLQGHYFYGDYCLGWIRSFKYENGNIIEKKDWGHLGVESNLSSFGQDSQGELYVCYFNGNVYKLVASVTSSRESNR